MPRLIFFFKIAILRYRFEKTNIYNRLFFIMKLFVGKVWTITLQQNWKQLPLEGC